MPGGWARLNPDRNAAFRHARLGLGHCELAIVENAGGEHRIGPANFDAVDQVIERAKPSGQSTRRPSMVLMRAGAAKPALATALGAGSLAVGDSLAWRDRLVRVRGLQSSPCSPCRRRKKRHAASNTTPVLVLRFEGQTQDALHRIEGRDACAAAPSQAGCKV